MSFWGSDMSVYMMFCQLHTPWLEVYGSKEGAGLYLQGHRGPKPSVQIESLWLHVAL